MKRKTTNPGLAAPLLALAKVMVNKTPDGDVGYTEAADMVSEMWDQFDAAGASVGDLEAICGYIRYCKFEGFCEASPIA